MLLAHRDHIDTYNHLLTHPLWEQTLAWIKNMPEDLPLGEHNIQGRDMYANYFTTKTVPRAEAVYEAHQQYVDFHYCLTGGELIEWAPAATLEAKTDYDAAKDYTLYHSPAQATTLIMLPHSFAVFLPGEAHMPKITDGNHADVKKVVVKIKLDLVLQ